MHASNLCIRCRSIKANTSSRQNVSPHKGLDNLHADVISSQRSFYFCFLCGMEFQCTSGSSAPLLFPCTVADSETHTARLNSHKLLCRSSLLSLFTSSSPSTVQAGAGGDCSSGSDYKSTAPLLLMKSP